MIRLLDRLVLVAFAIVLAALAALVVCVAGLVNQPFSDGFAAFAQILGLTALASVIDGRQAIDLAAILHQAAATALALWLGPIVLVAVIGEAWGKRSWVFHAVGMAVAFGIAPLATGAGLLGLLILYHAAAGLAAIGVVAGSVYWLVAGRGAGRRVAAAMPPA